MRRSGLVLLAVALLGAAGATHAQLLGFGWRGREPTSCTARAPPQPAELKASVVSEGSVALSWTAGDAAAPPPTGPACVSGYSILVTVTGQPAKDGKKFTTKVSSIRRWARWTRRRQGESLSHCGGIMRLPASCPFAALPPLCA